MTENRTKYISKSLIQRYGEMLGISKCLGASLRHTTMCRERFERMINPNATDATTMIPSAAGDPSPAGDAVSTKQRHATQLDTSKHVHQAIGMEGGAEANPMFSSAKTLQYTRSCRSCVFRWRRCPCQKVRWRRSQESVRSGIRRASSSWEGYAVKINMKACPNTVGECRRCDADEVLATVAGVRSEPTQMQRRRYKRSSMQTVISTRMHHEAKRNKGPAKNCDTKMCRCNAV